MLYGLLDLSFWGYVIAAAVMMHITIMAVTLYLHRSQAHRALELHPIISHFCRFWLWFTTGMETQKWIAIHRKHHAKCETVDDPHSPQVLGLKKVLFEGAELYRAEAKNAETITRYGQGAPTDWLERNVYTKRSGSGVFLLLTMNLLLFGIPGITIWALQMMCIPFFAAGVVNGIGHYWGYRNFECSDAARNVLPWGIIMGGEELHNNHHTFGTAAKLSVKWWEFDIGWAYIRLLQAFGLAKPKKVPPKLQHTPGKSHVDLDTLTTIVTNRFHVMARYSREVIMPVLREEKRKAGEAGHALLNRAKTLLIRAENLVDEQGKQNIAHLIENHNTLKLVYQFRLRLQEIWGRTTASQKELLEALQEWCKQAEATGITVLREFATKLAGYSSQNKAA